MVAALSAADWAGSSSNSAATPSATLRVGTMWIGRSVIDATWRAARTTFGLLGRIRSSSARVAWTASSSSPVDGFALWPPRTIRNAPYSRKCAAVSVRIAARPSDGATATTPSGRRVAGSASASGALGAGLGDRGDGRGNGPGGPAGLGDEGRGLRLADVVRLAVQVLDGDPRQGTQREPVGHDGVRPLVVDVDLGQVQVAGHQDGLADGLEVRPDHGQVQRPARTGADEEDGLVAELGPVHGRGHGLTARATLADRG